SYLQERKNAVMRLPRSSWTAMKHIGHLRSDTMISHRRASHSVTVAMVGEQQSWMHSPRWLSWDLMTYLPKG
ncbi:hypothetical protein AB1N83_011914, partial [Pleurotus pulmonarius]